MYKLLAILVFTGFAVLNGQEPQTCTETDNACFCVTEKGVINLTPLGNQNETARFLYIKYDDSNQSISYNPCFPVTLDIKIYPDQDNRGCQNVAACLHENITDTNRTQFRMGLQTEGKFGKVPDKDEYTITYASTEDETKQNNITQRTLAVKLVCNEKVEGSELAFDDLDRGANDITVTLSLTSKCNCPGVCPLDTPPPEPVKKGLSTGSVLVIMFFVFVVVYILGGVLYNKIVLGASGVELLPNVEFWSAFPLLVIDGVRFTCNCCQTRRIGSTYDNM